MLVSGNLRRLARTPAPARECANFARARSVALQELAAGLNGTASHAAGFLSPKHAIAIPVRNEAHRTVACLDKLAAQRDVGGQLFRGGLIHVVLLFNNCSDGSYAAVKHRLARWPMAITAHDITLPDELCHAGHARRLVNHAALRALPSDGVLFTTDADSRVPPDWITRYTTLIQDGCDAVAGMAVLSPDDHADIPASLMHRNALEERYANLLDELEAITDPLVHDPWPRHYGASGANMAVRANVLRSLHDFPATPCGEDRQLMATLERADHRVRHDTRTRVQTSGRLFGRAVGGKADTLRHRVLVPEAACDERLECAETAHHRATLRAGLRNIWQQAKPAGAAIEALASGTGLASATLRRLHDMPCFGEAWNRLEAAGFRRSHGSPAADYGIARCEV